MARPLTSSARQAGFAEGMSVVSRLLAPGAALALVTGALDAALALGFAVSPDFEQAAAAAIRSTPSVDPSRGRCTISPRAATAEEAE